MKPIEAFILLMNNFQISYIILLFLLIIFVVYAFYLKSQLNKNNRFLESISDKLKKIDNNLNNDKIIKFLTKLENTHISGLISKDHIFNDDVMKYLYEDDNTNRIFLHYTKDKSVADNIINEGFKFVDSFHKTAEGLYKDKITFVYKHNLRKQYGKFVIVIAINNDLYNYYNEELKKHNRANLYLEHILSEYVNTDSNEYAEKMYLLPFQFIKGYVDNESGEIVNNPNFNPSYKSEMFDKNLQLL